MQRRPIMIMAGGTGGHVYPALAVAAYLRERGVSLLWLGTRPGLEAQVVPRHRYPIFFIRVGGVRGKGIGRRLVTPFTVAFAVLHCLLIMLRRRPAAVLGMGGFAAGPGGLAAWLLRIPLLIHEQNAVAGLTNRILAPLARVVMQGFPGAFGERGAARTTGNPVRADIAGLPGPDQRLPGRAPGVLRVLVLGGSQGARALNQCVPDALKRLAARDAIEVRHQTGRAHLEATRAAYRDAGIRHLEVAAFIDDMAGAYGWADLVICRAGAITIAELCVVGVAAVLVPFPFAVDDHQTANARHLVDSGGALLLPERSMNGAALAALLQDFLERPSGLREMARRCRQLGIPDATRLVGEQCLEAAYG